MGDVTIKSSSTSGSATVELKLSVKLTEDVPVGGAIVLYLEDDFQEPDSISASDVYFVSTPPRVTTGSGARVYATQAPEIDTSDHFTPDKDDIDIRVSVPDLCTTDTPDCQGNNGLMAGDTVTLVFQKSAGIKNPSEAGTHSVGASVLGPTDDVGDPMYGDDMIDNAPLKTVAKITLSDVDNSRGYEMTVTGSGFNNGTSAGVYVYHTTGDEPSCEMIISMGTQVGDAVVTSDDKAIVMFEVTAPTFGPGNTNYICMVDGEGRMSDTDVEDFKLEPSIKVVPSSVSSGDTVNVFAQDFPYGTGSFTELKIAGRTISGVSASSIRTDGSGEATFEVPGGLEGVLRIDAKWGERQRGQQDHHHRWRSDGQQDGRAAQRHHHHHGQRFRQPDLHTGVQLQAGQHAGDRGRGIHIRLRRLRWHVGRGGFQLWAVRGHHRAVARRLGFQPDLDPRRSRAER